jgi:hypothetical protein
MKVIGRLDPVCSGSALHLANQAEIIGIETRAAWQRPAGDHDYAIDRHAGRDVYPPAGAAVTGYLDQLTFLAGLVDRNDGAQGTGACWQAQARIQWHCFDVSLRARTRGFLHDCLHRRCCRSGQALKRLNRCCLRQDRGAAGQCKPWNQTQPAQSSEN